MRSSLMPHIASVGHSSADNVVVELCATLPSGAPVVEAHGRNDPVCYTPRQPSSTEVPMRLIGLVIFAASIAFAPLKVEGQPQS